MEERLPIPIKDAIPTIGLITFNSGRSFDFLHSIVNRGTIEYVYLERRGEEGTEGGGGRAVGKARSFAWWNHRHYLKELLRQAPFYMIKNVLAWAPLT